MGFEDRKLAKKSQVVTSWTIKTDIGVGSSRLDFNAFTTDDFAGVLSLFAMLSVLIGYFCWSLRLWSMRKRRAGIPPCRSRSTHGKWVGDDDTVRSVVDSY